MARPPLEVADLIRAAGTTFYQRSRKWFTWLHLKILTAIVCCRTSALGGHIDECSNCGHSAISFNSCRNRHCPKCQSNARDRWLTRRRELSPRPCGVHAPQPTGAAGFAEQERNLRTIVSGQRRDAVDSGSRRETPRGGHRLLQRAPYVESKTAASSACPLRSAGRRIVARPHPVDCGAAWRSSCQCVSSAGCFASLWPACENCTRPENSAFTAV